MQKQNRRFFQQAILVVAGTLLLGVSGIAFGQEQSASTVAMFEAAAKEPTNIAGVSIIADRPEGFNPMTATNEELGRYGLPQRPNQQADPDGFARWSRGMQALKYRAAARVKARPQYSKNLMPARQQPRASEISGKPTQFLSLNWSGVANTNQLTSWDSKKSFDKVESVWIVPLAQPPFRACTYGITGAQGSPAFYEASWNGIDGFSSGDVLQGGSVSAVDCQGGTLYIGWVEWYPSYPILEIDCAANVACPVQPGDEFFVVTYGANSTNQFVFEEDVSQGWYGTFELAYLTGPPLVGSSVEEIVERPCCDADGYPLALANYFTDFFTDAVANDGQGDIFVPGQQDPPTVVIDMVDDGDTQKISVVKQIGARSLLFQAVNCAFIGGCFSF